MMDRVYFRLASGKVITPYETYGIFLKAYDAPPPAPKVFMVDVEGADGAVDMSEWSGDVKYENRPVSVQLLDTIGNYKSLLNSISGRKCDIWFSNDTLHYYTGRFTNSTASTRRHITDIEIEFTCEPWKLSKAVTKVTSAVSSNTQLSLKAERKPCIPKVTLTQACTLTWDGEAHQLQAGEHTPYWLVVTDERKTLTVNGSGNITLEWRDGVI